MVKSPSEGWVFAIHITHMYPGWWFGTWFLWISIQLGMSSSHVTKSIIFQRGGSTTNQNWWMILGRLVLYFFTCPAKTSGIITSPGPAFWNDIRASQSQTTGFTATWGRAYQKLVPKNFRFPLLRPKFWLMCMICLNQFLLLGSPFSANEFSKNLAPLGRTSTMFGQIWLDHDLVPKVFWWNHDFCWPLLVTSTFMLVKCFFCAWTPNFGLFNPYVIGLV